jgi:hypothetical protein
MTTLVEATDYDIVEPGTYDFVLVSVTRNDGGQYGRYVQWEGELAGPDGAPVLVSGRSSDKWGPTCKARRWLEAVTGKPMRKGVPVDLDSLGGFACRVEVDIVEKDKGTYNRLVEVLPAHSGGVGNPEPVTGEPAMDAEEQAAFAQFIASRKAAAQHADGAAA